VALGSGRRITYGPCAWPWQISELWGAMIEIADLSGSGPVPKCLRNEIKLQESLGCRE
jgi:hypothetical protein